MGFNSQEIDELNARILDLRMRLALYETWGEKMIHVLRTMRAKGRWKGKALLLLREIETGGWRKRQ